MCLKGMWVGALRWGDWELGSLKGLASSLPCCAGWPAKVAMQRRLCLH